MTTAPRCGWTTLRGHACTVPMPCPYHENARKRKAEEDAARERQRLRDAAPKCGFTCRDGAACTHVLPCPAHGMEAGMKDCSSTLDGDPFARCRKKVKVGELFCDCHKPFPDLGRKAAIYGDACVRRGEQPTMQKFLAEHYPDCEDRPDSAKRGDPVAIHDIAKYCASMRAKFAA